jgi:hypothetical protein
MPELDSLTVKQMLAALKLYHADIAISNEKPNVVGAPGSREPPQADLAVNQWQIPGATAPEAQARTPLRPDANEGYQPPMVGGAGAEHPSLMSVAGTLGGLTSSPASAYLGSLLDQPGDHRAAAGKAWDALKQVPASLFQKHADQQFSTPAEEMRKRGVDPGAAGGFMLDTALDPATYVGGDAMDLGKLGVLGAMALPGGVGKLKAAAQSAAAAAREGKALAKALESVTPALRAQLEKLATSYPELAKAIGTHGATTTLEGRNRSLTAAFDRVAQVTHDMVRAEGGASVRPLTGETAKVGETSGWMAGKYSNQSGKTAAIPLSQFTPADVSRYMEQHADALAKDPSLYVGGWHDKESGTVYLDISKKHETARKAALEAAYQRQPKGTVRDPVTGEWPKAQKAIFNPKQVKEIDVGNFAEHAASPLMQQRLDEMFDVGSKVMNGKDWWNLYGSDLERVYGKERVAPLAAMLASTSPASAPVHNLRSASEYLRRLIKDEPMIQKGFRIPETAIGSREGMMGAMAPGDYSSPGKKMPMERTRAPNLRRAAEFDYASAKPGEGPRMMEDKVNDMFHALTGMDVGVYDRRYAKLFEDWEKGIYAEKTKDKLKGSMKTGKVGTYALIENALRDGAKRHGMNLSTFTANVWEGIGETIKKTGKLYGMKQQAHSIPEASLGFPGIFNAMVAEKAKAWGVTVEEFEKRLRNGDAELLTTILATPVGLAAYKQYLRAGQETAKPGA